MSGVRAFFSTSKNGFGLISFRNIAYWIHIHRYIILNKIGQVQFRVKSTNYYG